MPGSEVNEGVPVSPAAFPQATSTAKGNTTVPLSRFYDVKVKITAELGRLTMPLGDLMELGPGSVLELDRTVSDWVDVVAQGVRIASGEVVVVNDRYGIRITEIDAAASPESPQADHRAGRVEK